MKWNEIYKLIYFHFIKWNIIKNEEISVSMKLLIIF